MTHFCPLAIHQGRTVPILVERNEPSQADAWREYESAKRQLPIMPPREYEQAIQEIAKTLNI